MKIRLRPNQLANPDLDPSGRTSSTVQRRGRSSVSTASILYWGVAPFLGLALTYQSSTHRETIQYVLASAMLWLSLYPTWRYVEKKESGIPLMAAIALVFFSAYGLPTFTGPLVVLRVELSGDDVTRCLALALGAEVLMFFSFYSGLFNSFDRLPAFRLSIDLTRSKRSFFIVMMGGLAIRVLERVAQIPAALGQLAVALGNLAVLGASGLFLVYLRGGIRSVQEKIFYLLAAATLIFLDLGTGSVAAPLLIVLAFTFVYISEKRKLPIFSLGLVILITIPFLGTKMEFRGKAWKTNDLSVIERSSLFVTMTVDALTTRDNTFDKATDTAGQRSDHLSTFVFVSRLTPDVVPLWGGETYVGLLWSFVPRLLYPDKPVKTLGQEFGHRYGLLGNEDTSTSYNFEQLVELYANFGSAGVLIGMMVFGLIYRSLRAILNNPNGGEGAILIGACVLVTVVNIESDFSLVFGSLIQTGLVYYVVMRIIVARPRRTRLAHAGVG
jgi:hypothetical protein